MHKIHSVAVIGGGLMGAGIALIFANGGIDTHIVDPDARTRAVLPERFRAELAAMEGEEAAIGRIRIAADLADLPWDRIDLVIEAAPEKLPLKQEIFSQLEQLARPDAILASNTSGFPISQVAGHLKTPGRVAGAHFFYPATLVPLVEVIKGEQTDAATVDRLADIFRSLSKVPIKVQRELPGFVANRMQHALNREAFALVDEGVASIEDVDAAVRFGFGFRYLAAGPLLQKDFAGLDTHYRAACTIYPSLAGNREPGKTLGGRYNAGDYGVKTGRGLYDWTPETAAAEKRRYEALLLAGLKLLLPEIQKD